MRGVKPVRRGRKHLDGTGHHHSPVVLAKATNREDGQQVAQEPVPVIAIGIPGRLVTAVARAHTWAMEVFRGAAVVLRVMGSSWSGKAKQVFPIIRGSS